MCSFLSVFCLPFPQWWFLFIFLCIQTCTVHNNSAAAQPWFPPSLARRPKSYRSNFFFSWRSNIRRSTTFCFPPLSAKQRPNYHFCLAPANCCWRLIANLPSCTFAYLLLFWFLHNMAPPKWGMYALGSSFFYCWCAWFRSRTRWVALVWESWCAWLKKCSRCWLDVWA